MIINTSILIGEEFKYLEEAHMEIEGNKILSIGDGYENNCLDYKKYLAAPSFFNSHTHVGDSFAKEAVLGCNVSQAVGKRGLKWTLYQNSSKQERINAMGGTLKYMVSSGTTGFSDFRENGSDGVDELKTSLSEIKMHSVILGRDVDEDNCDGLGLNLYQSNQIPTDRKKFLVLHAGEKEGEVEKALEMKPDAIIHFTKASVDEIKKAARDKISVVVCPRSNALLKIGFSKVREMLDAGVNVSLGTDNVMLNQPDMFREMEFLSKISCLFGESIEPLEILRMATYGAQTFNINSGVLGEGMNADLMFIDKNSSNLKYSKNILASLVHRCEPENVRKVMLDGNLILDKDLK